jgi:hypothetical protein
MAARSSAFDWPLLGGLLALGGVVALVGTEEGRNLVTDFARRGRRLSTTKLDTLLRVPVDPAELARAAAALLGRPVDLTAYALARMLRSEEGSATSVVKRLIAWVALNDAAELGWPLARTLTYSTKPERNGWFGRQITRRYSTAQDPYENDLLLAEAVLLERDHGGVDPTGGAVKFVNKRAFAAQAGASSYEAVEKRWAKEGLRPAFVVGAPSHLVFFRRSAPRVA